MKIKKQVEFDNIIRDILKNEEVISLRYEYHHGISRLDHSLNVAHLTYNLCKLFKIKTYNDTTRAALLHDFYHSSEESSFTKHPYTALKNAKREFNINKMQEDIIYNHMFPATLRIPKYKETWVVTCADKIVALKECAKYKLPAKVGAVFLFIFNFMIIQR